MYKHAQDTQISKQKTIHPQKTPEHTNPHTNTRVCNYWQRNFCQWYFCQYILIWILTTHCILNPSEVLHPPQNTSFPPHQYYPVITVMTPKKRNFHTCLFAWECGRHTIIGEIQTNLQILILWYCVKELSSKRKSPSFWSFPSRGTVIWEGSSGKSFQCPLHGTDKIIKSDSLKEEMIKL